MFIRNLVKFFTARSLWEQVVAGLIVVVISGIVSLWWYFKPKPDVPEAPNSVVSQTGPNSISQTAAFPPETTGGEVVNRPMPPAPIVIKKESPIAPEETKGEVNYPKQPPPPLIRKKEAPIKPEQ
jgi:type IV secretory pathway VirB10-like protein